MDAIKTLIDTVARIRDPKTGCPWNLEQTMQSLARCTVEETAELVDALQNNDTANIREELGDLLFHVVLYCQHAQEEGLFTLEDVARDVDAKIKRRKPWVFGDVKVTNSAEATATWQAIKAKEKTNTKAQSVLPGIPKSLPALAAAHEIQKRACAAGFKWPDFESFFPKIHEELGELQEAVQSQNPDHIEEELGDTLFTLAITGWFTKTNPELALRRVNNKFTARFQHVEKRMAEHNLPMDYAHFEHMETYWQEAKKLEKSGQLKAS